MKKILLITSILLSANAWSQTEYLGQTKGYIIKKHNSWHISRNDSSALILDNNYGYSAIFVFDSKNNGLCKIVSREYPASSRNDMDTELRNNGFIEDKQIAYLFHKDNYTAKIVLKDIYGSPSSEKITLIYSNY